MISNWESHEILDQSVNFCEFAQLDIYEISLSDLSVAYSQNSRRSLIKISKSSDWDFSYEIPPCDLLGDFYLGYPSLMPNALWNNTVAVSLSFILKLKSNWRIVGFVLSLLQISKYIGQVKLD